VSDKTTALMERERLSDLIHATVDPALTVSANTIPRTLIGKHGTCGAELPDTARDDDSGSVSPVTVLLVLAMLVVLFAAIVRL
jgi:hypothetical protein